jgi:hypothetical protein
MIDPVAKFCTWDDPLDGCDVDLHVDHPA